MDAVAPKPDTARVVARLSTDYVLRVLRLLADLQNGQLLSAIIVLGIVAANTGYLNQTEDPTLLSAGPTGLPPDEARRPVSVLSLSASLGLPFETTRRHVNKLVIAGACQRVKGGVIVPASALDNPAFLQAAEQNLAYAAHFVRGLRRTGLRLD